MPRQARGHTHLRSEDAELGTRNTSGAVLVFSPLCWQGQGMWATVWVAGGWLAAVVTELGVATTEPAGTAGCVSHFVPVVRRPGRSPALLDMRGSCC